MPRTSGQLQSLGWIQILLLFDLLSASSVVLISKKIQLILCHGELDVIIWGHRIQLTFEKEMHPTPPPPPPLPSPLPPPVLHTLTHTHTHTVGHTRGKSWSSAVPFTGAIYNVNFYSSEVLDLFDIENV